MPRAGPRRSTRSASSRSSASPRKLTSTLFRRSWSTSTSPRSRPGEEGPASLVPRALRGAQPGDALHATDVMRRVADFVPKDSYRVDLESPERTILVVVAGGSAMMSVVKGYGMSEKYHHFHIHSAADLGPPSTVSA